MKKKIIENTIPTFLLILFPISLLIGTAVSEIFIIILVIFFFGNLIKKKEWYIFNNKLFILLLLLWFYLIINYLISHFNQNSIFSLRNITFIKYILFTFAVIYFLRDRDKFKLIFFCWSLILCVVIIDIYFEFIFGHNLLGLKSSDPTRIGSFLGEELKVGHFILGFSFLSFGFYLEKYKKKKKQFLTLLIFALLIFASFITGERSNFIRTVFCSLIFFTLLNNLSINKKIIFVIISIFLIFLIFNYSQKINIRYGPQLLNFVLNKNIIQIFKETQHGAHYKTAIEIFKKNIYFGIGNKQFRIECNKPDYFNKEYLWSNQRCSTHPHQIYLELLSEHGLVGTIIILSIIFFYIFTNAKFFFKNKNYIHLASIIFTMSIFIPIIPSGSFFTSFSASIFWLNFAIMNYYSIEKKIFDNKKNF
jgi:O-antigen ligase